MSYQEAKRCVLKHQFFFDKPLFAYCAEENIDTDLDTIIHIPIEHYVEFFSNNSLRIADIIDTTGLDFNDEEKKALIDYFDELKKEITNNKTKKFSINKELLKNNVRDFTEKKLRFLMLSKTNTQVHQYVYKNIVYTLNKLGHDAKLVLENSDCEEYLVYDFHKEITEYNPHAIISINTISHNIVIPEDIYQFCWIQDPMSYLFDDKPINLRKRDKIFSLVKIFDSYLDNKNVAHLRQSFCINKSLFRIKKEIKKEEKIIFVGSSYRRRFMNSAVNNQLLDDLKILYIKGKDFTPDIIKRLSIKYNTEESFILIEIIPYIVRDYTLELICQMKLPYKLEVYGRGWESNKIINKFYKREIQYGEDLADLYNSAMYSISPHSEYILQQRVLESAGCGCIPIVYDCRYKNDEPEYEESLLYYKNPKDIPQIINSCNPENKNLNIIVDENTYEKFATKLIEIVREK